MATLAAIEAVPTDSKDKPSEEIVLVKAMVFTNPIDEMEDALELELQEKIEEREVSGVVFRSLFYSLCSFLTSFFFISFLFI